MPVFYPPHVINTFRILLASASTSLVTWCCGCSALPEAPRIEPLSASILSATAVRIDPLLPTEVLLLGEQHDAAQHQQIEQQVIALLAARGLLAAIALEMADAGVSTASLKPSSTEQQVKSALKWDDRGWPWESYAPAVMTAVRAGVPVLGANLPRAHMQGSSVDGKLDGQLPGPALKAQQQLIRIGHCNLLPESQITPMTRIQIAKDISMAKALSQAVLPGKTVVMLSGNAHADRKLGIPQHLGSSISIKAVRLLAGQVDAESADQFDGIWTTPVIPEKDYCADFKKQMGR